LVYEGASQAVSYVYNWATGSSAILGRSGEEFSADFELIYNQTIAAIFGDAYNSFDSELQQFVDEKVGGARAASDEFDHILRACKNHKCAKYFIKENKRILNEYVDEVECSQNNTLKEMTDSAVKDLITNIKESSLKIIIDIGDVASSCFVCEGKQGGAPNPCLIDGVPVIPAANPDSIQIDADLGKGGAIDAMRTAIEHGKIVISGETDDFNVKLEHLKEEFKKCSSRPHHSSSSSEEY
jgi:hypothetical protein